MNLLFAARGNDILYYFVRFSSSEKLYMIKDEQFCFP